VRFPEGHGPGRWSPPREPPRSVVERLVARKFVQHLPCQPEGSVNVLIGVLVEVGLRIVGVFRGCQDRTIAALVAWQRSPLFFFLSILVASTFIWLFASATRRSHPGFLQYVAIFSNGSISLDADRFHLPQAG